MPSWTVRRPFFAIRPFLRPTRGWGTPEPFWSWATPFHELLFLSSLIHRPLGVLIYSSSTAYFNLGYYNEAVKQYSKALQLDPSNATLKESLQKASLKAADKPDQKPVPAHLQVDEPSASSTPPLAAGPSASKPAALGMPTLPDLSNFNMNNLGGMMSTLFFFRRYCPRVWTVLQMT